MTVSPTSQSLSPSSPREKEGYIEYTIRGIAQKVLKTGRLIYSSISSDKQALSKKELTFLTTLSQALKYSIVKGDVIYAQFQRLVPSEKKSAIFDEVAVRHSSLKSRFFDSFYSQSKIQDRHYQRGDEWVRRNPYYVMSTLKETIEQLLV